MFQDGSFSAVMLYLLFILRIVPWTIYLWQEIQDANRRDLDIM